MALNQRLTYSELAALFVDYSAASARPNYLNLAGLRSYSDISSKYATYADASAQNTSYDALATFADPKTGSASGTSATSFSLTGKAGKLGSISASTSTAGAVTGAEGDLGLITTTTFSTGQVAGSPSLFGASTATTSTSSTVIGIEGDLGNIVGGNVTTASVVGSAARFGSSSATAISTGNVSGVAAFNVQELAGSVAGLSTSSGSVLGNKVLKDSGGKRKHIMEPARFIPLRTGGAFGVSFSERQVIGTLGYPGQAEGSNESEAIIFGALATVGYINAQSKNSTHIEGKSVLRRHVDEELLLAVVGL